MSRVVPGMLAHHHALLAQEPVDERRLADVRPSDDRDRGLVRGVRSLGCAAPIGQPGNDLVEQLGDAVAMLGGNLDHRLEPQLVKLEHAPARAAIVGLVHRHHDRPAHHADAARDLLVARDQTLASIHDEDEEIRGLQRFKPLLDDQRVQRVCPWRRTDRPCRRA